MSKRDLIGRAIASLRKFNSAGWARAKCPLCDAKVGSRDRRGSFAFNGASQIWMCFRCGAKGKWDGPRPTYVPREAPQTPAGGVVEPPEHFLPLTGAPRRHDVLRSARGYLASRGVSLDTIAEAGIGVVLESRHSEDCPICRGANWCLTYNRIVIPVTDASGVWRGWVGRHWQYNITPDQNADQWDAILGNAVVAQRRTYGPRYLYPIGMQRGEYLFNEGALQEETDKLCLVVEGCFDALPYWPDAVATLGKATEQHMAKLIAAKRPVVVAYDGDAWEEGEMIARRLQFEGVEAAWLHLPPKSDPNSVKAADLWKEAECALRPL